MSESPRGMRLAIVGRDQRPMPPPRDGPEGRFTRCSHCGMWGVLAVAELNDGAEVAVWVHTARRRLGPIEIVTTALCRVPATL